MIRRIALMSCWLLVYQTPGHAQIDPIETLFKILRQVAANISHLPNYLCTETISREVLQIDAPRHAGSCEEILETVEQAPSHSRPVASDRLRLDVALSNQSEMYSWVGEGRFDDRNLSEIVKQGTTSTGAFGSFLRAIFSSNGPSFTFKGEMPEGGRQVLKYDFVMPLARSGYTVSNESISRLTGYTGSFVVDAKTLDLLKLEIRTDTLPPELKVCKTITAMDYTKIQLAKLDVLLPSEVNVRMIGSDGHESRNRTTFSGCHQFLGESKLIFDEKPANSDAVAPPAAAAKVIHLAAGLKVEVALTQNIDPAIAAAGDPVRGRLTRPIKDVASGVIIPKGTIVNGRIFGLMLLNSLGVQLDVGLKWDSFEMGGSSHPLNLAVKRAYPGSTHLPIAHGQFREIPATNRPAQPGIGFFLFPGLGKDYQIPTGFEAEWVTVAPSQD